MYEPTRLYQILLFSISVLCIPPYCTPPIISVRRVSCFPKPVKINLPCGREQYWFCQKEKVYPSVGKLILLRSGLKNKLKVKQQGANIPILEAQPTL